MGKQLRAIIDLNLKELVKELNKAYCDEWLAFYLYWYIARVVSGKNHKNIKEMLEKLAKDELEHAQELANHICKLGDVPTSKPMELEKNAHFPYRIPPKNTTDINRIIRIVLEAESEAIELYNRLAKKTKDKDFLTHQLIVHILSEEVEHEELFENLLER